MVRRALGVAALLGCLLGLAAAARADGRLPFVGQIAFHPGDSRTIVARATFGVLSSEDDGASWRWVCTALLDTRPSEDPTIVVTADGSVLAATSKALRVALPGLCKWSSPSADLRFTRVTDVVLDPTDPDRAMCITGATTVANGVFASPDDGQTWSIVGERLDFAELRSIRVAPADPMRVYVSGIVAAMGATPRAAFVQRSLDGGETFERFAIALAATEREVELLGVDPTSADRLFARVVGLDGPDRLLRSDDGAAHWTEVLSALDLAGFAWSSDGGTVWAGSRAGGIARSDDGGRSFGATSGTTHVGCLAARGAELWACGSDFVDGFAIGKSLDRGRTFTPVLRLRELAGLVECDVALGIADTCAFEAADLERHLTTSDGGATSADAGATNGDAGNGSIDATPVTLDAGALVDAPPGGGGCDCRVAQRARGRGPCGLAIAIALGLAVAARRRRFPHKHPKSRN